MTSHKHVLLPVMYNFKMAKTNEYYMKDHIFELRKYSVKAQIIITVIHLYNLSSCEIKAWNKMFRPEKDLKSWPLDTGAVLYQLNYQANWKLVTLLVHNIPVDGKEYKWIYERLYISKNNNVWKESRNDIAATSWF